MKRSHYYLFNEGLKSNNVCIQNYVYHTLFEDIEKSSFARSFKAIIIEIFERRGIDPKNYNEYYNRVKADAASRCYMHLLELSKKDQINISYSAEGWFYRVVKNYLKSHWGEIMEIAFGPRKDIPIDEGLVINTVDNSSEEKSDKSGTLGGDNSEEGYDDTESIEERIYGYIDDISHQGGKGERYASLINQIGLNGVTYEQFAQNEGIVFNNIAEKKQYLAGLRLDYSRAIGCLLAIALPDFRRLAVTIYNDLVKWNELDSFIASTFRNGATDDQIEERRNIIKSICLEGQPANNDEKRRLIKGVFERRKEIYNKLVENNKKYFQDYRWLYNHYRNSTEQLRFELKIGVNELNELRDHFENEGIFKRFFEVGRGVCFLKLTDPERDSVKDCLRGVVPVNVNRRLSQNDFRVLSLSQLIYLIQNKLRVDNYLEQYRTEPKRFELKIDVNRLNELRNHFQYEEIFKLFFEVDRQVYLKLTDNERDSVKDYLRGIVPANVNRRLSQNDFRVLSLAQLIDLVQNKLRVNDDNYLEQYRTEPKRFELKIDVNRLNVLKNCFNNKEIFERFFEVSREVCFLKLTDDERDSVKDYLSGIVSGNVNRRLSQNDFRVLSLRQLINLVQNKLSVYGDNYLEQHRTGQKRFELKIDVNRFSELRNHFQYEGIFKLFFEVDRQVYLKLTEPERGSVKDYLRGIVPANVNRRLNQNDFRVLDLSQLIDLVQNKLSVYGDNYLEQHPVMVLNTNMNDCLDQYFEYGGIKDDNLFYNAICRLGNGAEYIQKNLGEISKDVKQHFDLFVGNHESLIKDNSVEEIVELFKNSYKINSEQRQEKEKKIVELLFG